MSWTVNGQAVTPEAFEADVAERFDDMIASARPPGCKTDREFLRGECNGSQFASRPDFGDYYASVAKAAGVSITGKVYKASIAAFPGDPEAWVSGRGDVQRVIEKRGWHCEGDVHVKSPSGPEPPPSPAVAPDIVEREVAGILAQCPQPERVDVQELREQVIDARKPPWKK